MRPRPSWRTSLSVCRLTRWSRSPSDWVGPRNVWRRLGLAPSSPARPTSATETEPEPRRSQGRSFGYVKHSTPSPDEMPAPDWRALRLVLNDRAAIYAEEFPAALAAVGPEVVESFTHDEAQGLLYTFAGAWPVFGQDASDPSSRFVYRTIGDLVCRFRGIELAADAIVIDDIASL